VHLFVCTIGIQQVRMKGLLPRLVCLNAGLQLELTMHPEGPTAGQMDKEFSWILLDRNLALLNFASIPSYIIKQNTKSSSCP
jgi:hypothetical protein